MKIKCVLLKINSFRVDMSAKCVLMVLANVPRRRDGYGGFLP